MVSPINDSIHWADLLFDILCFLSKLDKFIRRRLPIRIMELRFLCPSCGRKLKADGEAAGMKVECPDCGTEFLVPQSEVSLQVTQPEPPVEPTRDPAFANPNADGDLTCPVCWLRFDAGDIMHIAVHDSLRGDPLLGEDAQQRFLATRFNNAGQALDAMSLPSSEIACPHCRKNYPQVFLGCRTTSFHWWATRAPGNPTS